MRLNCLITTKPLKGDPFLCNNRSLEVSGNHFIDI